MVQYFIIIQTKKWKGESMKKLIALAICLGFILSVSAAYAAPVGNIAAPSLLKKGFIVDDDKSDWGVIAGSETDLNWNMNLKKQKEDTEYYFYGGKIGLLLMDRFIPYAILGVAEAKKQTYDVVCSDDKEHKIQWQTDYDFVWGVGGTAMLYETAPGEVGEGILNVGVDGRYRQSHLDVDGVVIDDQQYKSGDGYLTSTEFKLEQWQIALAVAYQYKQIVPYVGVKYSDASGEATVTTNDGSGKYKFENEDKVGIFVGGDIIINDSMTVNAEGRFIDETALSLGGTVRF